MWTPSFDPLEALMNLERGYNQNRFDINQLATAHNHQSDTIQQMVETLNSLREVIAAQHHKIQELEREIRKSQE
jgi:polyhydroxyalkanoate synthesis regulator phasin